MPTDLTTVRDHPATVLTAAMERGTREPGGPGIVAAASSIQVLRDYEQAHGVTFAALDHDALASVREAYADLDNSEPSYEQVRSLAGAISDLLGLE